MVTGVRRRKQTRDHFPRQFQKWCQQQPKSVIISHWPALQKQKCRMPTGAEVQAGVGDEGRLDTCRGPHTLLQAWNCSKSNKYLDPANKFKAKTPNPCPQEK